jgi:DNA polymerase-3 subunit delta
MPDTPLLSFRGSDLNIRDFCDALQSDSLFGGESVVVLDELDQLAKKTLEIVTECVKSPFSGYLILGGRTKALSALVEKLGIVFDLVEEKPWDKEARIAESLIEKAKNAGKRLDSDVIPLLFERLEKESSLLESELDKLICFVGDRSSITQQDVLQIGVSAKAHTLWQMAEEIIWERSAILVEEAQFHGIVPLLRSQLELGRKIAWLIQSKTPSEEWSAHLPKIWPKTLEKRTSQAARLGSEYFQKGLDALFNMELSSRGSSTQYEALLSLFRSQLSLYRS